jgi:hypothetical protein
MWDLLAVILSLVAFGLRWYDAPKGSALCGYGSALCWYMAARRAREHEPAHAD